MARRSQLAPLLLCCAGLSAGLRHAEDGVPRPSVEQLIDDARAMTHAERRKRQVVKNGTAADPYERTYHVDDWAAMAMKARKFDFGGPVCVTDVGTDKQRCKFLSMTLCDPDSTRMPRPDRALGKCFIPKKRCAVVGSSSHLLNVTWGKTIDAHDLVIRINAAPAGSHVTRSKQHDLAPHVGTVTHARFLNGYGRLPWEEENDPLRSMCLFLNAPKIPKECGTSCYSHPVACNITCNPHLKNPGPTCTMEPEKCAVGGMTCVSQGMTASDHNWGAHEVFLDNLHGAIGDSIVPHSTAGFKAIVYAMSLCESVTVFGFGPSCSGSVGGRYYTGGRLVENWFHHYEEELALLLKASNLGSSAIVPPEARMWLNTQNVTVALPECVDRQAASNMSQLFQDLGTSATINLVSEATLKDF